MISKKPDKQNKKYLQLDREGGGREISDTDISYKE